MNSKNYLDFRSRVASTCASCGLRLIHIEYLCAVCNIRYPDVVAISLKELESEVVVEDFRNEVSQ